MRQLWLDADLAQDHLTPTPDQARRLRKVLRLREGAALLVADGRGARRPMTLTREGLVASAPLQRTEAPARRVIAAVGLLKGERQGWLLQKLTEVGADVIAPLALTHCVVRLDERRAASRMARWQAVVVEAFEQCGRSHLPELWAPQRLAAFLGALPDGARVLWGDERGDERGDARQPAEAVDPAAPGDWAIVVGPEGGLSDAERALLDTATAVDLGPSVLRAETAAIVATWALAQRREP